MLEQEQPRNQCDQIVRFFKVLGNKCFHKKEPKYLVTFGAILKYTTLKVKTALATFWATFGKMGIH